MGFSTIFERQLRLLNIAHPPKTKMWMLSDYLKLILRGLQRVV